MTGQIIAAKLNHLRIAPRKTRLVADLIKGLRIDEAQAQLLHCSRKASKPLLKLLNSAVANALNNYRIPADSLRVFSIRVDGGPMFKRWTPRARGAVNMIQKKTSHVTLILEKMEKSEKPRFAITVEKKKKQKKASAKKHMERKEKKEKEVESSRKSRSEKAAGAGGGFFRRIFRRKAI